MPDSWWGTAPERHLLGNAYKEIAEVVGWERAIEIGFTAWQENRAPSKRTGIRGGEGALYVPQQLDGTDVQQIVRIAGKEDALKLVAAFRGEQFFFPSLETVFQGRRNKAIVEQVDTGYSIASVALCFDMTPRQVRRICAANRAG